jgi:hypothetical protein
MLFISPKDSIDYSFLTKKLSLSKLLTEYAYANVTKSGSPFGIVTKTKTIARIK